MTAKPRGRVLRPNPGLALEFDFEGQPYLSSQTTPYHRETPLTDGHRQLLACFSGPGTAVDDALHTFLRFLGEEDTAENLDLVDAMVSALEEVQALVPPEDQGAFYPASMAEWYLNYRTIPKRVTDFILREGKVKKATRVLDVGTGVGGIANVLAAHSNHVTAIDAAPGLLQVADREAKSRGVKVRYERLNANRLVMHPDTYDLVVISLAIHWMDPFRIANGFMRILKPKGRLILIDGGVLLKPSHPLIKSFPRLAPVRLHDTRLQYGALFRAAQRPDPRNRHLAVQKELVFDEHRTVDVGYARGYVTPTMLKDRKISEWRTPELYWEKVAKKVAKLPKTRFKGMFRWVALSFGWKRG